MLRAAKKWAISGTAKAPPTTARQAPRTGEYTVYSPTKFRETEGIKDVTAGSYTASKIQQIDKGQWEDNANAQGATSVIKRLTGTGVSKRLPANPTPANASGMYRVQRYNQFEASWDTVSFPSSWYDCSTWGYYYAAGDVQYDYVGYFASSYNKIEETKTVLAQPGST